MSSRRTSGASCQRHELFSSRAIPALALLALLGTAAGETVVEFEGPEERDAWFASAGDVTTIGFCDFGGLVILQYQFADLGVIFGIDNFSIAVFGGGTFPNDGWGVNGDQYIEMFFTREMHWIAIDFPGNAEISLFDGASLIYESTEFFKGFGGLVSDKPFNRAVIIDPAGGVFIDDLHFGPPLPAGPADLDGNGRVDVDDLVRLIVAWGDCPHCTPWDPELCEGDVDRDCDVDVDDLVELILAWGTLEERCVQ